MSSVIPLQRGRELRAERIALAAAERVRELAEDLAEYPKEYRALVSRYYLTKGWATTGEISEALRTLEEMR